MNQLFPKLNSSLSEKYVVQFKLDLLRYKEKDASEHIYKKKYIYPLLKFSTNVKKLVYTSIEKLCNSDNVTYKTFVYILFLITINLVHAIK